MENEKKWASVTAITAKSYAEDYKYPVSVILSFDDGHALEYEIKWYRERGVLEKEPER